jgi:hypothetical protein
MTTRSSSSSSSKSTRDHEEIRRWADARHAVPCEVSGTESGGSTGILRFEFSDAPNRNDNRLQEISWEDFFEKFDNSNLELLYQETTAEGEQSNFNKFVHPENSAASRINTNKRRSASREHKAA